MRVLRFFAFASSFSVLLSTPTTAGTLGDARVGFTAERMLILDGRNYAGRMWHMPGKQRHEQNLQTIKPVFILHTDSAVGQVVLPQLHTVVEFALPIGFSLLSHPDLSKPIGQASIDGIATTQYLMDQESSEGHASALLWLSSDGIPMKCEGKFVTRNGKLSTIDWQLYHVRIGVQDAALFEVPRHYAKLSPEAAAPLLGLRLAPTLPH
jgi:hypothetical protein